MFYLRRFIFATPLVDLSTVPVKQPETFLYIQYRIVQISPCPDCIITHEVQSWKKLCINWVQKVTAKYGDQQTRREQSFTEMV